MGRPWLPVAKGRCTQGRPSSVQLRQNSGSPVAHALGCLAGGAGREQHVVAFEQGVDAQPPVGGAGQIGGMGLRRVIAMPSSSRATRRSLKRAAVA